MFVHLNPCMLANGLLHVLCLKQKLPPGRVREKKKREAKERKKEQEKKEKKKKDRKGSSADKTRGATENRMTSTV